MPIDLDVVHREVESADHELHGKFSCALEVNHDLNRPLVSFQVNKSERISRWFKYKEGFSAKLVRYLLSKVGPTSSRILDPFAGVGTTLFEASDLGINSYGIELLPNAILTLKVRKIIRESNKEELAGQLHQFKANGAWRSVGVSREFPHLAITEGAFPTMTEHNLGRFMYESESVDSQNLRVVLRFAAMCVLESISFTRKDGQYLRWDGRANRRQARGKFNKGTVLNFDDAIEAKLDEIIEDVSAPSVILKEPTRLGDIELATGSSLDVLPSMEKSLFGGIITSPPYCNRYDYTRTYALELALLGVSDDAVKNLRQTLLSSTVENKEKADLATKSDRRLYDRAMDAYHDQVLLQLTVTYLNRCAEIGELNNSGIPRMVSNYFREMSLIIFECARVLQPGAPLVMVNDNVRYKGVNIPVDLILSDIAEKAGFNVERIWVLPRGKGNSSQQMGQHGREEARKCVYVWRRQSETSHSAKSETLPESVKLAACANSPVLN